MYRKAHSRRRAAAVNRGIERKSMEKEKELQQYLEREAAGFAGKAAWLFVDLSKKVEDFEKVDEFEKMEETEKIEDRKNVSDSKEKDIEKDTEKEIEKETERETERETEKAMPDKATAEKWCSSIVKYKEEEQVISASTIKVPVMLCLFDYLRENGISVETKVEVKSEQICSDSTVFEYGAREASLYELTIWMIINSDNTATNVLLDYLGFDRLNAYFDRIGLTDTRVQRHMLDYEAVAAGKNNYISPVDFWHCMEMIWEKKESDPDMAMAFQILTWNRDDESLLRYLYENPVCAHKSGELDQVEHDAGIFCCEKGNYFLGIFLSEMSGEETQLKEACKLIGRMSRAVYDYYNA